MCSECPLLMINVMTEQSAEPSVFDKGMTEQFAEPSFDDKCND